MPPPEVFMHTCIRWQDGMSAWLIQRIGHYHGGRGHHCLLMEMKYGRVFLDCPYLIRIRH